MKHEDIFVFFFVKLKPYNSYWDVKRKHDHFFILNKEKDDILYIAEHRKGRLKEILNHIDYDKFNNRIVCNFFIPAKNFFDFKKSEKFKKICVKIINEELEKLKS